MEVQLFLTLVAGHYLADFGLQSQYMAENKRLVFIEAVGFHSLTAHAFIHALVAGVLSGSFVAALIIGLTHWLIDFGSAAEILRKSSNGKKGGLYSLNTDQALHIFVIFIVTTAVL